MSSTVASVDAGLLAWYDGLSDDPPGHRLEVVEGVLVVTPSPSGRHQDRARSLANIIDLAVAPAGLRAREDVEWPLIHPVTGLGNRLRPDVSVMDPDHPDKVRVITVEVISASDHERLVPGQPETRIEGKRRVYAYGGTQVHVEVDTLDDVPTARWYAPDEDGQLVVMASASGDELLEVGGPHPFDLVPAELDDWLRRHVQALEDRAAQAEAELRRMRNEPS